MVIQHIKDEDGIRHTHQPTTLLDPLPNVFVESGLLPFNDYDSDGRSHALAVSKKEEGHPYSKTLNEEFDFIFTNPPFSVTLSEEEKTKLERVRHSDLCNQPVKAVGRMI